HIFYRKFKRLSKTSNSFLRRAKMPKHTKKRSTIKRKHRRMKQHAEKAMKSQHDNRQGTN
ncbi:hypothetical protein KGF68_15980, partial [Lactiplantibacillus pentosus]|nr:hypothetical protein [Lactiplantibacillus sp. 30.2.29]MBU7488557.1 hypothetical protein [Lactiplantibacillus pentosus]MBU7501641.1 hypothetical protein [Lactiplantibacillus pentosus]MBU7508143.1 hypothetical protein [Lactiplantibacillus pentosus]MBU7511381.1 hypothetical protein [Lactiplantibacillus pentosus]